MERPRALLAILLLLGTTGLAHPVPSAVAVGEGTRGVPAGEDAAKDGIADARGIIVSCWRWGYEWADPEMGRLLETLPEVGANWVAIHPYAHISRETGTLRWSPESRVDHMQKPIRWAHQHGLRIMIKPHVSYWGEFPWRGEIGWADQKRWDAFRRSYRDWIVHLAGVAEAEGADLFVVGTELRKSEGMEGWWRKVIQSVRQTYSGPLTYAANWDDYQAVPFWDALDYIGVQAYFPLTEDTAPSIAALRRAWKPWTDALSAISDTHRRPVLLTEIGYSNTPDAAARPWEGRVGPGPTGLQERCLRVALETARETPAIAGAFVWKWFPTTGSLGPTDFTVQTPEFKKLLRDVWLDPAPGGKAPVTAGRAR